MVGADRSALLAEQVRTAAESGTRLVIRGSGSKCPESGQSGETVLDVTGHHGIISYEPTELVINARAGTPLEAIETALAGQHQMLAFEPPHFGPGATLGGTIACNLSGPRRPYCGAARDFVLGTTVINGRGEILKFGGQVMKNVAGYDISRLMAGSFGTLGVLLDISLKVLPRPAQEITLRFAMNAADAIQAMNVWAGQPLPLSAAAHSGDTLYVRLSGSQTSVHAARTRLGGEILDKGETFWEELREQRRSFFATDTPLWRLSVPPATGPIDLPGKWLLDWGGAQRWLDTDAADTAIHAAAARHGGYASLARATGRPDNLPAALRALHASIRQALDPAGIFTSVLAS